MLAAGASFGAMAAAAPVVLGQTAKEDSVFLRPRPYLAAEGISIDQLFGFLSSGESTSGRSSWVLFPKLDIAGYYDDNIFRTANDEEEDFIVTISPALSLVGEIGQSVRVSLGGTAEIGRYTDNDNEDYEDYALQGNVRVAITELVNLTISGLHRWDHEERANPNPELLLPDGPAEYQESVVAARLLYNGDPLGFWIQPAATRLTYDDAINEDRDRFEYSLTSRVFYRLSPGTIIFVEPSFSVINYDELENGTNLDRGSEGYQVLAGFAWDLTGVTFVEIGAGYFYRDYEDPTLDSVDGFALSAEAFWNPSDVVSVRAQAQRRVAESTSPDVSGIVTTSGSLRLAWEVSDFVIVDGGGGISYNEYDGSAREDLLVSADIGVKYHFNEYLYAGARYYFSDRNSDVDVFDFTSNRVMLQFGGKI